VVSFTPLPLLSQGKHPQYSLDRRLGRPQSGSYLNFRSLRIKYDDYYLIAKFNEICGKKPRIILKVVYFECIISRQYNFYLFLLATHRTE
jgi:hypothetical protein